jgi:hypothetical protein
MITLGVELPPHPPHSSIAETTNINPKHFRTDLRTDPTPQEQYGSMNVLSTDDEIRVSGKTDSTGDGEHSSIAQTLWIVCFCKNETAGAMACRRPN